MYYKLKVRHICQKIPTGFYLLKYPAWELMLEHSTDAIELICSIVSIVFVLCFNTEEFCNTFTVFKAQAVLTMYPSLWLWNSCLLRAGKFLYGVPGIFEVSLHIKFHWNVILKQVWQHLWDCWVGLFLLQEYTSIPEASENFHCIDIDSVHCL